MDSPHQVSNETFPRRLRIATRKEILKVQSSRLKSYSTHLLICRQNNQSDDARFAFTVSKKVSKRAVVRNKVKRRLREVVRTNKQRFEPGFDYVIIGRTNIQSLPFEELRNQLLATLRKKQLHERPKNNR